MLIETLAQEAAPFYAEDAVAFPPNEPVAIGRAVAREVWARYFVDPSSWRKRANGKWMAIRDIWNSDTK